MIPRNAKHRFSNVQKIRKFLYLTAIWIFNKWQTVQSHEWRHLSFLLNLTGRGHHQFETRDTVVVASEAASPTGNGTISVQPLNSRKNSANPFLEPAKRHSVDMKGMKVVLNKEERRPPERPLWWWIHSRILKDFSVRVYYFLLILDTSTNSIVWQSIGILL